MAYGLMQEAGRSALTRFRQETYTRVRADTKKKPQKNKQKKPNPDLVADTDPRGTSKQLRPDAEA